MSKYDCIIFDLDGTLIDSSKGIIAAVNDAITEMGRNPLEYKIIKSCIGPPIGDPISKLMKFTLEEKNKFTELFREYYSNIHLFEVEIYPGIKDLLKKIKDNGITTCIATNKREDYAIRLLDYLELSQFFNIIECMDLEEKFLKKDLINRCIDKTNSRSKRNVMIGDTINDLNAANACNVEFIAVTYGYGFKDVLKAPCKNVSDPIYISPLIM